MSTKLTPAIRVGLVGLLSLSAMPGFAAGPGQSFYDRARVVSSTPVYEEINEPRRDCWTERVTEYRQPERDRNYGGAIIGGLAGGILGHQLSKGSGKNVATVVGATTGAIVGDRIDNSGSGGAEAAPREVERCKTVDNWTRRITGYNVVYRYQGHDYTTFLPRDPGPELKVRVDVGVAENW
jgi:uncharacterized protein YcfJ